MSQSTGEDRTGTVCVRGDGWTRRAPPPVLRPYYDLPVVTSMCSILWLFLPAIPSPPMLLSIGVDDSSTLLCWPGFFPSTSQRKISPTSIEGGMESPLLLLFPGLRSIWRSFLHACPCSRLVLSLALASLFLANVNMGAGME